MKALKWILAIPLILILSIGILFMVIDPNDYREDITTQAKEKAGINLRINGEISWSFIPLGIELNDIKLLDQNNQTFTQFNNLTLEIDTFSLLALSPNIHAILLDGLAINLIKDQQGNANWENIVTPSDDTSETKVTTSTEETTSDEDSSDSLNFLVNDIRITNASLNYKDLQAAQEFAIDKLQLVVNDIAMNQLFPVSLGLESKSNLFKGNIINTELSTQLKIDTSNESILISGLELILANFNLNADIEVTNYLSQPLINGAMTASPFALNTLLEQLGQSPIATSNPDALKQVSFSTQLSLAGNELNLSELNLGLDKSNWKGETKIDLNTQAVSLSLAGDQINVDDYLPPKQESTQAESTPPPSSSEDNNPDLLPLDTIRGLDLNIALTQQALSAVDMQFSNMDIKLIAKDGVITQITNTKLFDGNIASKANINAAKDNVSWKAGLEVSDLNILEHLEKVTLFGWELGGGGTINLSTSLSSLGNDPTALQNNAQGEIDLNIKDGALTGINLNKLACDGFASINRKQITKTDWANETRFSSLEANASIDGNVINSNKLVVENIGLKAEGEGRIDLNEKELAYFLDIYPSSALGDEACEVNEKVQGVAIPLKCEGSFDTEPGSLCGLNTKKLGRIAEKLLKAEAKRKAEKEIDRAIDKKLNKYVDEDSELGNALKKGLKGLFQ